MMADTNYSGTTKPLERDQRDKARKFAEREAAVLDGVREQWLIAEKARLSQHRTQLLAASRPACALCGQEIDDRLADSIGAAGVAALSVENDRSDDDFQRVNTRGGVLQRLNLFVGHVVSLLRLRQPKAASDSTQAQRAKDAK